MKLFGRHLTISSANTSTCHWIENEGKKLEKKIKWLQEKIETLGTTPVIKRITPGVVRDISRSANAAGHTNLRKLKVNVSKLGNQLAELGLSHYLISENFDL